MIKFFSDNLVRQANLFSANENKMFPVFNLKDPRRSKVFRSIGDSSTITFDFLEKSLIDSVIIVPDARTFFGFVTATLKLSEHGDFDLPDFETTIDIFEKTNFAIKEFETKEYRFAQLVLTSSLGYCELSKVFIGQVTKFEDNMGIDLGWSFTNDEIVNQTKNSLGQVFTDLISRQKRLDFAVSTMNKDELEMMTWLTDRHGTVEPFFVSLDIPEVNNIRHRNSGYYRFNDIPSEKNKAYGLYDSSYKLLEAM